MKIKEAKKWINHPLYKLAEVMLIKERKFREIGRHKFVLPELVVIKMAEIVNTAHKQKQKKQLEEYIKGSI